MLHENPIPFDRRNVVTFLKELSLQEMVEIREGNLLETMIVARWEHLPLVEYSHLTHLSRIQMCLYDLWEPYPEDEMWKNNQEILKFCPKLRYYNTSEFCPVSHPGIEWLDMTPETGCMKEIAVDCPNLRVLGMRFVVNVGLTNSLEALHCGFSTPDYVPEVDYVEDLKDLKLLLAKIKAKKVVLYNVYAEEGQLDEIPDLPVEPIYSQRKKLLSV